MFSTIINIASGIALLIQFGLLVRWMANRFKRPTFAERMRRRGIEISSIVPEWAIRVERGETSWVVAGD